MSLEAAAEQLRALEQQGRLRTQAAGASHAREAVRHQQWTTFMLDGELFAIDVMKVKEVLRFTEITPVPGAPRAILGIINLRGSVVTILDTRRLFGLGDNAATDETRIIVVEFSELEVVGLVVDRVDEVLNLPQQSVGRAPNVSGDDSSRRFVQGVSYHNGRLTILLDLARMLQSITPANADGPVY